MSGSPDPLDPRFLQAALLGGGVGLWDWDLQGEQVRLSPNLEALLALPSGAFSGTRDGFLELLHPLDRGRIAAALKAARHGASGRTELEFRVTSAEGQLRWFVMRAEITVAEPGGRPRLAGTMQEISATIVVERRMRRQQAALLDLATHDWLRTAPLAHALARLSEVAAETLEVDRVGIWLYDEAHTLIRCLELFERTARRHSRGDTLRCDDHPLYFALTRENRAVAIADAGSDPRTSELVPNYLRPRGITSLLDAPVRQGGVQTGLVCCEHIGPQRTWMLDEQNFAASLADLVSQLLEADARREAELRLRDSEERYRAFVQQSTEAIWRADIDPPVAISLPRAEQIVLIETRARLHECNIVMARMLGHTSPEEVVGQPMIGLVGERRTRAVLERLVDGGYRLHDYEASTTGKEGVPLWLTVSLVGVIENGLLKRVWGTWRDISDRRRALDALEHQTLHDSLTGLPNRRWLDQRLGEAIAAADRDSRHLALILIDLDHFKEVNDTLGHVAGDQLLKAIGPRLQACIAAFDGSLVRLGGDEFAALVCNFPDPAEAEKIARALLQEIRQPFDVGGARLEVSASIGIAVFPRHGVDASTLLRRADVAMYVAKRRKSSGYAVYRVEDDPHSPRRLDLLSELGTAIRGNQLDLHYQPKVSLREDRLTGLEVLARWPHPRHGMVPPEEFVRLAEMGELIKTLTAWVLDRALAQWNRWSQAGFRPRLSVNLSPRSLIDDLTVEVLRDALERHRVPAAMLELELTESAFLSDPERALSLLRQIQAMGVGLAIDDFGTGFSSLAYLRRMPLSALKIDKSFVLAMQDNAADATIVSSTINLAHNLGLAVVAEGIESEASWDSLRRMGCDEAQGYWIAQPMPAVEVEAWYRSGRWKPGPL